MPSTPAGVGVSLRFHKGDVGTNPDAFVAGTATISGTDIQVIRKEDITDGYEYFSCTFTVPADAIYLRVLVFIVTTDQSSANQGPAGDKMTAYIDDMELTLTGGSAPLLVDDIVINKTETTVALGGSERLSAIVYSDEGTDEVPQAVMWTSSNPDVAEVSNTNAAYGTVTAKTVGQAIITATTTTVMADGTVATYTDSCLVTVEAGRPEAVYGLTFVPTFNSCSVYIEGGRDDLIRRLYYRKAGDTEWKDALEPLVVNVRSETKFIFSGSIVRLEEDTEYEVRSDIYFRTEDEEGLIKTESGSFRTWSSNPPITQTISLSSIYSGGSLTLDGYNGSESGWIKIINDSGITIDAREIDPASEDDNAVSISNCSYLILEDFVVRGGGKNGIQLASTAENVRILNADVSEWGQPAVKTITTQDEIEALNKKDYGYGIPLDAGGSALEGQAGVRIDDAFNIVVERSYVHEPRGYANGWTGIRTDGVSYSNSHPQGPEAIFIRSRGGTVIRYNDLSSGDEYHRYNDVVSGYYNPDETGGFYKDADIYGNFMGYSNDDIIELDGGAMNIRVFDNRFEMSYCGVSFAPTRLGPSYVFNNVFYNMIDVRRAGTGTVAKMGGNVQVWEGFTWFINNTIYAVPKAIVGAGTPKGWYGGTRNNMIVVMRDLVRGPDDYMWNISDNDMLNPGSNFDYDAIGRTTVADGAGDVNAKSGAEANGIFGIGSVVDLSAGVFTPTNSGIDPAKEVSLIDQGAVINNFTDGYAGSAPDIGAFEAGESSLFPKRPIPFESDKYFVAIPGTEDSAVFTVNAGSLGGRNGSFSIRKPAEEDWYTVTPSSSAFSSNGSVTFTITVDRTKGSFNRATEYSTLFIRFEDGFSIPITVTADADPYSYVQSAGIGETAPFASSIPFPGQSNQSANWRLTAGTAVSIPENVELITDAVSVPLTMVHAGLATLTANSSINGVLQAEYLVMVPARLSDLQVSGVTIEGFDRDTFKYKVVLPEGTTEIPTISATSFDADSSSPSTVSYSYPKRLPGTVFITVTSADGTATSTYEVKLVFDKFDDDPHEEETRHVSDAAPVEYYTIHAIAGAGGGITPSGSVSVQVGGSQTFVIYANDGYEIDSVVVDGVNKGALSAYTFSDLDASHSIVASFKKTAGSSGQIPKPGSTNIPTIPSTGVSTLFMPGAALLLAGITLISKRKRVK